MNGINEERKRREMINKFQKGRIDVLGVRHICGSDGKERLWEGVEWGVVWAGVEGGRGRQGCALFASP